MSVSGRRPSGPDKDRRPRRRPRHRGGGLACRRAPPVEAASRPLSPAPITATSTSARRTSMSGPESDADRSAPEIVGSGGRPSDGWRTTANPGRARSWHVRTYATPSTWARQFPQSPVRHSGPPPAGVAPVRRIATATDSPGSNATGRPSTTMRPASAAAPALDRSVTGASLRPSGRTAARAAAAPGGDSR